MKESNLSSLEALSLLIEGNLRFSSGLRSLETALSVSKMRELAENGQSPFAIVLTCSDSRVPTEMIFDRGLGDIFVVRVAGNVVTPSIIASVEFAALNFGSPICVVMGHSGCGAVKAALATERRAFHPPSVNLEMLVRKIRPAARWALRENKSSEDETVLSEATLKNVSRSSRLLVNRSPVIADLVKQEKLMVVSAFYDLHNGQVRFEDSGATAMAMNKIAKSEGPYPSLALKVASK